MIKTLFTTSIILFSLVTYSCDKDDIIIDLNSIDRAPLTATPIQPLSETIQMSKRGNSQYITNIVPFALTGVGAFLAITLSCRDIYEEGLSSRRSFEIMSHGLWLSSAISGVAIHAYRYLESKK